MKKVLLLALLLPLITFAQTDDQSEDADAEELAVLKVGIIEVTYDAQYATDAGTLYYQEASEEEGAEVLVASGHDFDNDEEGDFELWLVYADGSVVVEGHDTTGDGRPDVLVNLDEAGEVESITGASAEQFTAPEPDKFYANVPQASDGVNTEELIGDLSDISIEKEDYSWMLFIIMLIAGGLFYFFFKRQN